MIKARLQEAIKTAMKSQDKAALAALRLIHAAIRQREIDERIELNEEQAIIVLDKMIKQRRESVKMYQEGGRQELADKELFEIEAIQRFLPQPLTEAELDALIASAFADTNASSMANMGKVMGIIKPQIQGKADMSLVSKKIKEKLA